MSFQVTPRTEAPMGSAGASLESALHTSVHCTEDSPPKRTVGKHAKGERVGVRALGEAVHRAGEHRCL